MSISSLLSLLPLSCMVVPIETDCSRGHSAFPSFNSSRETSANSTAYSMDYADCIQAQANNLTWAEQVENGEVQSPSLSYAPLTDVILDYKGTSSSELILFCIFWLICIPWSFPYLHSSAHLISHAPDPFMSELQILDSTFF